MITPICGIASDNFNQVSLEIGLSSIAAGSMLLNQWLPLNLGVWIDLRLLHCAGLARFFVSSASILVPVLNILQDMLVIIMMIVQGKWSDNIARTAGWLWAVTIGVHARSAHTMNSDILLQHSVLSPSSCSLSVMPCMWVLERFKSTCRRGLGSCQFH